jgi:hypothetical protein
MIKVAVFVKLVLFVAILITYVYQIINNVRIMSTSIQQLTPVTVYLDLSRILTAHVVKNVDNYKFLMENSVFVNQELQGMGHVNFAQQVLNQIF